MGQVALAPGHAREYETIYVMRPSIDSGAADGVANRVHDAIKGQDGTITDVELWGRRRLAYQIQRHHRGIYVYVKYLGRGDTVSELERQLRLIDEVIRFQTIVLRSNVPTSDVSEGDLALDFDMPDEADEPELTRERELGLDNVGDHRRRDRDRDRRDRPEETDSAAAEGSKAGEASEAKDDAEDDAKADAKADAKDDAKDDAPAAEKAEAAAPKAEADKPAKPSTDEES